MPLAVHEAEVLVQAWSPSLALYLRVGASAELSRDYPCPADLGGSPEIGSGASLLMSGVNEPGCVICYFGSGLRMLAILRWG